MALNQFFLLTYLLCYYINVPMQQTNFSTRGHIQWQNSLHPFWSLPSEIYTFWTITANAVQWHFTYNGMKRQLLTALYPGQSASAGNSKTLTHSLPILIVLISSIYYRPQNPPYLVVVSDSRFPQPGFIQSFFARLWDLNPPLHNPCIFTQPLLFFFIKHFIPSLPIML